MSPLEAMARRELRAPPEPTVLLEATDLVAPMDPMDLEALTTL